MKKKVLIAGVFTILLVVSFVLKSGARAYELPEVTITCDSGHYGRCHAMTHEAVVKALGEIPIIRYMCKFSGMQDDSCSYWNEVFMNIE